MEIKKIRFVPYAGDTELFLVASKADLEKRITDSKLDEVKKTFVGPGNYCEVTIEQNGATITCALPILSHTLDSRTGKYLPYNNAGSTKVLPVISDLIENNKKEVFEPTKTFDPNAMNVSDITAIANNLKTFLNARKASITDTTMITQIDTTIRNLDNVLSYMVSSGYKSCKADVQIVINAIDTTLKTIGINGNDPAQVTTCLDLMTASKKLKEKAETLSVAKKVVNKLDVKSGMSRFATRHPKLAKAGKVVGPILLAGGIAVGSIWGYNTLTKDNGTPDQPTPTPGISSTVQNNGTYTIDSSTFNQLYQSNLTRFSEFQPMLGSNYATAVCGYTFIENCASIDVSSMDESQLLDYICAGDDLIRCCVSVGQYGNISPEAQTAIRGGISTSSTFVEENNALSGGNLLDFMTVGNYTLSAIDHSVVNNTMTVNEYTEFESSYLTNLNNYALRIKLGALGADLNHQKTLGQHPATKRI